VLFGLIAKKSLFHRGSIKEIFFYVKSIFLQNMAGIAVDFHEKHQLLLTSPAY
jgi:hypothetical protein